MYVNDFSHYEPLNYDDIILKAKKILFYYFYRYIYFYLKFKITRLSQAKEN